MMQVTNTCKCNYKCGHCLWSCGPHKKGYLSTEILKIALAECDSEFVNYCGGETFLHPEWEEQLREIAIHAYGIRIVTNGSKFFTKSGNMTTTLRRFLYDFMPYASAKGCEVSILISDDWWHDDQADELGFMFGSEISKKLEYECDGMYYNLRIEKDRRTKMDYKISPFGRALKTNCYDNDGVCSINEIGGEWNLSPEGHVFGCCNNVAYCGTIGVDSNSDIWRRLEKVEVQDNCRTCKYRTLKEYQPPKSK